MSRVLTECGLPCSHEIVFTPSGISEDANEYKGESSWFATPYLDDIKHLEPIYLVQLLRDPIRVISSLLRIGHFGTSSRDDSCTRFLQKYNPKAFESESPLINVMRHWIDWNTFLEERANCSINVEDLDSIDIEILFDALGQEYDHGRSKTALAGISKRTNTRDSLPGLDNYRSITPEILLESGPIAEEFFNTAIRLGYPEYGKYI